MSRIWKLPINIPSWVTVNFNDWVLIVKWPKWSLDMKIRSEILVNIDNNIISLKRINDEKFSKSLHWLLRTLIFNMICWVNQWFEKKLQIVWVWYSVKIQWNNLLFNLGYSHPIEMLIWEWITAKIDQKEKNVLIISWIDKQKVWEFSAQIRRFRKPEPYKWKWIKYFWEYIKKKAWKATKK